VQVPVATSVTVLPLTVQTAVVSDEELTGNPDDAVALTVNGREPSVRLLSGPNAIVWVAWLTLKLRSTLGAATYVALPACEARTVHVPNATSVTVLPPTVHTPIVSDEKPTVNPDDAVAVTVNGAVPNCRLLSWPKVMVWLACVTLKV
jgi:hypothetical protein